MHRRVLFVPPDTDPPPIFTVVDPTTKPIWVAPRTRGKKRPNVFYDDCGFTNQSQKFDIILHNVDSGCILRKRKNLFLSLMILIHYFIHPMLRLSMAKNCARNWTSPIWTSLSIITYTVSSRNTGNFLRIRNRLSPSRITYARLTPALPSQAVSKKSTMARMRSQLCTMYCISCQAWPHPPDIQQQMAL